MISRKHRTNTTFISLSIIFSITLILGGLFLYLYISTYENALPEKELRINIPIGTTLDGAIELFDTTQALRPNWFFKILAKIGAKKYTKTIKAGYYKFPQGINNYEILKSLFTGEYLFYQRITFPEGINYLRFASILHKRMKIDSAAFVRLCTSDSLLKSRQIPALSVEGYLAPSTYSFSLDASLNSVIDEIMNTQDKLWKRNFAQKARNKNKSRHEILTMASIVESETPVAEERARVAGVYWNRIARNMLLQADPTVQYAIKEKRRLLYSDLASTDKYNTYKYPGLPPGPINSPGKDAIEAAINPESHNFLFFVAVGDGSGRHNFARNFTEHRKFVNEFRKNVRKGK